MTAAESQPPPEKPAAPVTATPENATPDSKPRLAVSYARTRHIFLRFLAAIYFFAFWSLGSQIIGLAGEHGIAPAGRFLDAVAARYGTERFWLVPTLCWLDHSDGFLRLLCIAGAVVSVLLFLEIAPALMLFVLWALYLSLTWACGEFLMFQWDTLLLETGFLAIFLAPLSLIPRRGRDSAPSRIALYLLWWLLFRLMLESGLVKLASGDATWRDFSALTFHYETQPLPTWIGWYAHQSPKWFQQSSVIIMYAIELIAPWLILFGRRGRRISFWALLALQILIALTGNYGFFNLLAIALCTLLLDD